MIDARPLKEQSNKFQEPLKSLIDIQRDAMPESDFISLFMALRKKARELDAKQKKESE